MKNNLCFFLSLFGAFFSLLAADAQPRPRYRELEDFQDSAQYMSVLYRGKQATNYRVPANGHIYWSTPEFQTGNIIFESRYYDNVNLNIDAVAQEVLVLAHMNMIPVALNPANVDEFTIDGTRFVNVSQTGVDLPDVIYEVIAQGDKVSLYKNVQKGLRFNAQESNGKSIGYDDPLYRYDEKSYYEYMPSYYLVLEGRAVYKVKNKLALRRHLREYRKEIRECVSEYENKMYGVYFDEYAQIIINYINQ